MSHISAESGNNRKKLFVGLPYLNNVWVITLTVVINLACAFIFFGRPIVLFDVLADLFICGIITSFINVYAVRYLLDKASQRGEIPADVPASPFMMHLPKNPFALALLFALCFGLIMVLISWLLILFFEITEFRFVPFLVWKIIYSCVLSAVIIEYVIFRFVQSDCLDRKTVTYEGTENVKNPLPRMSTFRTVFDSVVANLGMNLTFGLLFGGVVIQGTSVLIKPTLGSSIWISGIFFGILTCAMGVAPVVNATNEQILSRLATNGSAAEDSFIPKNRGLSWMPKSKVGLTLFMCIPVSIISAVCLSLVAWIFGFDELNFYQFTIVITAWGMLAARFITKIVLARCLQPDYGQKVIARYTKTAKDQFKT